QICDDLVPGRLLGLLQAVQVALQGRVCRLGVILRERLIELAQMSLAFWRIPWEATGDPAQIGLGGGILRGAGACDFVIELAVVVWRRSNAPHCQLA
ncbi:hypothetical protein RZS08_08910, partial [Arthrospira platensis SPKY1]|nr:hypothetical protein [Arthrospira platensis SPKY1]